MCKGIYLKTMNIRLVLYSFICLFILHNIPYGKPNRWLQTKTFPSCRRKDKLIPSCTHLKTISGEATQCEPFQCFQSPADSSHGATPCPSTSTPGKIIVDVKVNVQVYSPGIPISLADCTIYIPGIETHFYSLISSGENSAFAYSAAAIVNHYNVAFSFHHLSITAA